MDVTIAAANRESGATYGVVWQVEVLMTNSGSRKPWGFRVRYLGNVVAHGSYLATEKEAFDAALQVIPLVPLGD